MKSVSIKNKLINFVRASYFPFIFFAPVMIVFHAFITPGQSDDSWFRNILASDCSFEAWRNFLVDRYYSGGLKARN